MDLPAELSKALLAAAGSRAEQRQITALAFAEQLAFIQEPSRRKAVLCTRRAGKSFGIGLEAALMLARHPGETMLYIGLTRDTCKRIMCKDILDRINATLSLGWKQNKSELSYTHPNGAVLYLLGVDASEKEMAKVLGQKYRRVWIDEAQDFTIPLHKLIDEKLALAVADYRGTISMHGTPGDYVGPKEERHYFFSVTKDPDQFPEEQSPRGWKVYKWSALQNPHMRARFQEELDDIERDRPLYKTTPEFARHYQGRWALDATNLVYRFNRTLNSTPTLPVLTDHVVAIDLGYRDATAFCVAGWNPDLRDGVLYICRAFKHTELNVTAVEAEVRQLKQLYPHARFVVDGASRQVVEELSMRIGAPLEATEKTGKSDQIRMMNSDLQQARVKLLEGQCGELVDEYLSLTWDAHAVRRVEDPKCRNDLADATLYAWRYSRPYILAPRPAPKRSEEEKIADWVAREADRIANPEEYEDDE